MAENVNYVWNEMNEYSYKRITCGNCNIRKKVNRYDLQEFSKGASKALGIHSNTIQELAVIYELRRNLAKKNKLKWRKSRGTRRSLGWIPFKSQTVSYKSGQVYYCGHYFNFWDSYNLSKYRFRSGSFNEDARGRWYFNVVVEYEAVESQGKGALGIDLGCREAIADSNEEKVAGDEYRKLEKELSLAQRAKNRKRVKNLHAKIKNRRADKLHKYTRKIVDDNAAIFVGDVSSLAMIKTNMAKSVLDSSWGKFKTILEYKCDSAGVVFEIVNEAYTTQMCSHCKEIPCSSPKGRAGLGISEWICTECGTWHDRNVNAAKNIRAVGLGRLAEGIPLGWKPTQMI